MQKGFLWILLGGALGIAAYFIVFAITGREPRTITNLSTWGFCLFVGIFVYYINFEGAMAPDPTCVAVVQHATEVAPEAAAEPAMASAKLSN